mmetsp:Transcript_10407/g.21931  ORF Transcript_10407/g.21931 Transcript_10407/m.21931 type:complete len:430 (+) Transcript_10407:189-1478(+)
MIGAARTRSEVTCCFHRRRRVSCVWAVLVAAAILQRFVGNAAVVSDDEALGAMSDEELKVLLAQTDENIESVGKSIEDMKDREFEMREEMKGVEAQADQLRGAKNWEADEKRKRIGELSKLEKGVLEKQITLRDHLEQLAQLRQEVDAVREKKKLLEDRTAWSERRVQDPKIVDALEETAPELNDDGKLLLNRTLNEFFPELEHVAQSAGRVRARTPPLLVALGAVVLYAVSISLCLAAGKVYYTLIHTSSAGGDYSNNSSRSLNERLSLERMMFLSDSWCMILFSTGMIVSFFSKEDPVCVLRHYSHALFVFCLGANILQCMLVVFLRVLALSRTLLLPQFGEALVCVVVAHHYYICVWHRSLQDATIRHAYSYYAMYCVLFALLASRRSSKHGRALLSATARLADNFKSFFIIATRTRRRKPASQDV